MAIQCLRAFTKRSLRLPADEAAGGFWQRGRQGIPGRLGMNSMSTTAAEEADHLRLSKRDVCAFWICWKTRLPRTQSCLPPPRRCRSGNEGPGMA